MRRKQSLMRTILPDFGQLRTRLMLLMLLVFCPVFLLALYGNLRQRKLEQGRAEEEMVAISKLAVVNEKSLFDKTRQMLAPLTQFPFLVSAAEPRYSQEAFYDFRLMSPDYADFGLVEKNGRLFCHAALTNQAERPSLKTKSFFQEVVHTRHFAVGNLEPIPLAEEPVLGFGYPVLGTNREIKRVIYACLKLPRLSDALIQLPLPDDGLVWVLDARGNVLARQPSPVEWVGKNVESAAFAHHAIAMQRGVFEEPGMDGVPRLYAVMPVSDAYAANIFAVVSVPRDSSYAGANLELTRNLLVLGGIAALALWAAHIFGERLFLRPVRAMVAAADRLSRGDLSARTGVAEGGSELNHLAQAFDVMAARLETRRKELEEASAEIRRINSDLEQRVRDRTAQLEILNKELEAFSYSVSHDLRAPLRHINGYVDLLKEEGAMDPKRERYLKSIASSAGQMGHLVEDLLSFSRMSRSEMQFRMVNLTELAGQVAEELTASHAQRSIVWKTTDLPEVRGDQAMLHLVFVNLLSNAVKYTGTRQRAEIEIGYIPTREEHIVLVRDNGVGFDMKYVDKLFGVFQRLHDAGEFEGTGIGLANVQRIIHRHGGRTWAEGKIELGAVFYFSLPR